MSMEVQTVSYAELLQTVQGIFGAYLPKEDADWVGQCLVEADARGIASHGVTRVAIYARRLRKWLLNPRPAIKVESRTDATAYVDGDNGMGFVVGRRCMEEALARGKRHGISMVTAGNSNHYGMASSYIRMALDQGMGAMALTNAAPLMPVWGSRAPFLGSNPFAFGLPGETPLLLDMSCSVVAFGKVRRASRLGQSIPEGWALDKHGNATTDPKAAEDGGVVLPMGGAKGSGLALLIDALAGVMAGAAYGGRVRSQIVDDSGPQNVGHLFMVFSPDAFMPGQIFRDNMEELVKRAKGMPLADGFTEIYMPGEIEERLAAKRKNEGIQIPVSELAMLKQEAETAGFTWQA